ncbi:MAG: T9SS type A sorting domain-containing protein [Candidatus Eisenbacteria bacterium]|nr:T9SS type A sorting domain-containing protein [Candidatus Eisenbacteria bacterium]
MRRVIVLSLGLSLVAATAPQAGTFERARIVPDLGLDAITRGVTRQQVGRELFSDPWATATIGHVDLYDVFPYVESRTFQIVSDPRWNRLVIGEAGRALRAYDGAGTPLGRLSEPRGLAVDENDRVYVADAGNDRIVVLQASTTYGEVTLEPLYEIRGLSRPFDVAWSDGGTPFTPGDDALYVADTGRNRVAAFALGAGSAREVAAIGDLGSGPGRFAGPMAIRAGREDGRNTHDVFVADAHNGRLVRLLHDASGLHWASETKVDADVVTSLDTDQWGNLYAAAPNRGVVRKYAPDLSPVAELRGDLVRPRNFHVPFFTVRDHRTGTVTREGRANGLTVEEWTDASGVRLWNLGLEVPELAVAGADQPEARFTLTDRASVVVELLDATGGAPLVSRSAGTLEAGAHTLALTEADRAAVAGRGDLRLRLVATSMYAGGPSAQAETGFRWNSSGALAPPAFAMMLGSSPNPAARSARIAFALPAGSGAASLRVYDSMGRAVRSLGSSFASGRNEVTWDLRSDRGGRVAPGVYFARLTTDGRELSQRLVVIP